MGDLLIIGGLGEALRGNDLLASQIQGWRLNIETIPHAKTRRGRPTVEERRGGLLVM